MALVPVRPVEALFEGYVEGLYLPTGVFIVKAALYIAGNMELLQLARRGWADYIGFLSTLEERNLKLYGQWVEAVANELIRDVASGPEAEALGFVLGRLHRSALRADASLWGMAVAGFSSTVVLFLIAFPEMYLRAVITASKQLRVNLAKSSADRMLLRSAAKLARDLLPLAARFAGTAVAAFATQVEDPPNEQRRV